MSIGARAMFMSGTMLLGAALPGYSALAQESAIAAEDDAIIVTATRRSVALLDVPINIAATSAEAIERDRIDDVRDLSSFTPGLTIQDTGPRSTGTVILRGLNAASSTTGTVNANNAVGIYLGEVPLYMDFKFLDLARVETLLGPQGTLYGLGTLSGAIRYMPNRPNATDLEATVHGRLYDVAHSSGVGYQVDAMVNIPIVTDHIAFRSVVGYYDDPGFIDYPLAVRERGVSVPQPDFTNPAAVDANLRRLKDMNDEQTFTTRNTLLLQAHQGLRAFITYAYQQTETRGRQVNGAGVLGTGKYEAPYRFEEPNKRYAHLVSLEINADVGDIFEIVSATAYTEQQFRNFQDQTDLLLDLGGYGYEEYPQFTADSRSQTKYTQFNQELRLVSAHGGPFNWTLGGFYNRLKQKSNSREYTPGMARFLGVNRPDDLEYISVTDTDTKEMALFGEIGFQITPRWQVTGGLRVFKYDASIIGAAETPLTAGGLRRMPYPSVEFEASRWGGGKSEADGKVWKANTSYKITDDINVFATYSEGYRIGGPNRLPPCQIPLPPGQQVCAMPDEMFYSPDETRNKEVGVRASLFDRSLNMSFSVYHIDWKGIQLASRNFNNTSGITANAGNGVSKGFDFTFDARINSRLNIYGSYGYNDAYLAEDVPDIVGGIKPVHTAADPTIDDGFKGDRLPGTPKNSGSIGATYTYPLDNGSEISGNWVTSYIGNIYSRVGLRGFGEVIPSYVTHRASITYRADRWEASLFANNIFNKFAITSVNNSTQSILDVNGIVSRYYNHSILTPRVIGIETRLRF